MQWAAVHNLRHKYLPQHPILKHPQSVFVFKYEREILVPYTLNFIFFKTKGKTECLRVDENFSLLLIFY